MKSILIILILSGFSLGANAQAGKLKKADNYYSNIAYSEAAELYNELLGSEIDSPILQSKLANCYYQMGNSARSEEVYASMITTDDAKAEDVYNYAQALKENGKYTLSDEWMAKFHVMTSGDSRGREFTDNKTYLELIKGQGEYFSISQLQINTEFADFGGYPMGDGKAFFVSNRTKRISIQRFHSWNNKKFLDLYSADVDNGKLINPTFHNRKVNKKFHEGPLCFSPDGKQVYFTRNNMNRGKARRDAKGIQNLKIFSAQVDEEGNWSSENELEINSKDYSVGHPTISADGKTMYFASDMPGGYGGADIYKMAINEDGTFGKPENLGAKINTEGQDMFPWITSEGILFFSSDGHVGLGGLDVFAMIPKKDGSFKKLLNVGGPINSTKDDFSLIMNTDNLTGYVSSNRESGMGDDDIYGFTLLKPLKVNLILKGLVTDKHSNDILPGAIVNLLDNEGTIVGTTTADANGMYEFGLEPELDYTLAVQKEDYFDNGSTFSTKNLPDGKEELEENVNLEKDPGLSLYALITDAKTDKPLEGVTVQVVDNMTGDKAEYVTTASGDYLRPLMDKKLDDRGSYNFTISKEGFIPKTLTYNTLFDHEGQYDVHADLDFTLDPMVEDLRDLIEINPINFDLGKWNIRQDAKIELDKIVVVMNKYPLMEVELGSHTDCRASKAFNRRLSDKRAKSSAAYIKSKITNPERIFGKGYGESILLNGCECEGSVKSDCSEDEHEKNRRTEFKVISVGNPNVGVQNNSTNSFDNN